MNKGNILIVDDQLEIRELISKLLNLENYSSFCAENIDEGLKIISDEDIQVIVLDVRLNNINSIEYIPEFKKKNPLIEIIMLTAYGRINDGVQSIKLGAFDYITKGDDDDKIIPTVEKAMEKNRLSSKLNKLENKIKSKFKYENIIGCSKIIKDNIELAKKFTDSDTTILLTGETGTGKEVFAQAIHYESYRSGKPFVAINCSSIPKDILESELFGYKKGAFTGANSNKKGLFEEADGGTLFLDEISEMSVNLQAKLLRVLETNTFIKPGDSKETKVDVRIISATNKNIDEEIKKEMFRKDLFYRISTFVLNLPPLRERKEDITILAEYFITHFSKKFNKPIDNIDPDFHIKLIMYPFPGNVRELRNLCERVVILAENGNIYSKYLPQEFFFQQENPDYVNNILSLNDLEKQHIQKILAFTQNNKNKAADLLGIGLTTLYRKIEQYEIK
ncbi:MAG: sigma-54-dependent Fis family transcriptional regulator [Ignavibacteriales bacterium]|nr:sigma-54-dependent Fis family transcriptional regulator [Ignavibacteriales bacterium]